MSSANPAIVQHEPLRRLGLGWTLLVALSVFIVSLWYFAPGPVREWPLPSNSVIIGYFGNGNYLATVSYQEGFSLSYWDAGTGQLLRHLPNLTHPLNKRDFSPDGRFLVHVVRDQNNWQLQVTHLLSSQQDQNLNIPLHETMQKREKDNVYLAPAWSSDSKRMIFRQDIGKQQTACLWDIPNRKLIYQQQTGIYNDPNIIVRFSSKKNNYVVTNASNGNLIGEMPTLTTDSEFEFSATPDGSAFMVIGSSAHPPKLIKYRFDLKTLQLSIMWEKNYGSENHHIRYETSLRPPNYFLFQESKAKCILIDAQHGKEQDLPENLPLAWSKKSGNSIGFVKASKGEGPGLEGIDGKGTRIITRDGRYYIYQIAEPPTSLATKVRDWARTKLGFKLDTSFAIVQVDLHQKTPWQYIEMKQPGPGSLVLSPDNSQISVIDKRNDQIYLRQWAIPFPTCPWLLIVMISGIAGMIARFSPMLLSGRQKLCTSTSTASK